MPPCTLKICAILLCSAASARAAGPIGYADGLTSTGAGGWACIQGTSENVSVAAFAGQQILGIYPMSVNRPDVAPFCGAGQPHGFQIVFDPAAQALFTGQSQLSLYVVSQYWDPLLLPPSNPHSMNPVPLPSGRLSGLSLAHQIVATAAAAGGNPTISLFAGGPSHEGAGTETGLPQTTSGSEYIWQFPIAPLEFSKDEGAILPVFGTITSALGVTVPLAFPLALPLSGATPTVASTAVVNAKIVQSGSYNAIRNNVFTTWVPNTVAFAGLSGTVSMAGNNATFDEALVVVGAAPYGQAVCLAQNGRSIGAPPTMTRLWASILKSNAVGTVSVPVNFVLPYGVGGRAGGTCLMTWISAGYAYLSGNGAQYAATTASLQAQFVPAVTGAPQVITYGLGGEFRFVGEGVPTTVYVGIRATKPIAVDGIAGTASVAPVAGAPVSSGWLPAPLRNWNMQTAFVYMPASVCAKTNLAAQPTNGIFALLHNGTPGPLSIPAGAVPIMGMPIYSRGPQAIQRSTYAAFPPGAGLPEFTGILAPGDCLVAYSTTTLEQGAVLDAENQSTAFLRVLP